MMIFADTFYYIAFLSPSGEAHERASKFTQSYSGKMVTTEWVLTEFADGLAATSTRMVAQPSLTGCAMMLTSE